MFGIPIMTLLKVAAIAILALIVAGMVYAAYQHVVDKGRAEVREQYAPLIGKCGKRAPAECASEWTTAIAANVSLQRDLNVLRTACEATSKGVKEGGELKTQADTEKVRRLAIVEPQLAAYKQSNAQLERQLAAVTSGSQTCEQKATVVETALRDLARQRIRFALGFDAEPPPPPEPGTVRVAP